MQDSQYPLLHSFDKIPMDVSKLNLRYKKERKKDRLMEKERARVSKDSFLFLSTSTAQLLLSPKENFKRSCKQKDSHH